MEANATTGMLTKAQAQKLFLLVMPLADRNLYTSLKQERWAGRDMDEVRHVFRQLVNCVAHMHSKGMLHGHLKPSNIVRCARTLRWTLTHDTLSSHRTLSCQYNAPSYHIISHLISSQLTPCHHTINDDVTTTISHHTISRHNNT